MGHKKIELEECSPTGFRDLGEDYTNAFVTFIDILGFKNIIENDPPDLINKKLDAMAAFSSQPQRRLPGYAHESALPIVIQFSDSIIRVQPDTGSDELDIASHFIGEITSLLLMQGNLACNGILIRGGLTYGKVCVRSGRIFGPAFNRAYALESSLARYPRILIDEFLALNSDRNPIVSRIGLTAWQQIYSDIFEYLYRSEDGQWTIDYLTHMYFAEGPEDTSGRDVLVAHRESIKKLLKNSLHASSDEPKAKIRWAANYHNRIVSRNFSKLSDEFDRNKDSLIIDLDTYA